MPLTDVKVRTAKPDDKSYKLSDIDGLYLLVHMTGGKWWRFRYRFGGKEKLLSLGTYPEISLLDARTRRDEARRQIAHGIDPSSLRKAQKQAQTEETETFEVIAREWYTKFPRPGRPGMRSPSKAVWRKTSSLGSGSCQ